MKIIIIGAGVSGLATYLLLKKHLPPSGQDVSITIYEAYDIHNLTADVKPLSEANNDEPVFTPAAIGNALGIGNNGLNVLRRLDTNNNIEHKLLQRGNPIQSWRMSNARGWTLANASMATHSASDEKNTDENSFQKVGMLMIARQDLWEILRDEVLKDKDVVVTRRVVSIVIGNSTTKNVVNFEDGTSDEADLIIGADGLRSALRRAMFVQDKQTETGKNVASNTSTWFSSWFSKNPPKAVDYITPHYEGLGGFGGFIPTSLLKQDSNFDPEVMNIVFGANGFFGYGCTSSTAASAVNNDTSTDTQTGTVSAWWSTFSSPDPYPYRRPPPSSSPDQTSTQAYGFEAEKALNDLLSRHRSWKNPAIQHILDNVSSGLTANQYYPTWTTPELPTWQKDGRAVLIGDAAHALPPSSGQGVSQALEDSEALVLLLSHYLSAEVVPESSLAIAQPENKAVATALLKYEALRKPRVQTIYERAKKFGKAKADMGLVAEMMVYFFVWIFSMFHDKYNDILMEYDLPKEVEKIVAEDQKRSKR